MLERNTGRPQIRSHCLDAARGLNALGVHFIQLGSYEKAINNLQEALEVFTLEKPLMDYGETRTIQALLTSSYQKSRIRSRI